MEELVQLSRVSSSPFLKADKNLRVIHQHPLSGTPSRTAGSVANKPLTGKEQGELPFCGVDSLEKDCLCVSPSPTHDVAASLKKKGFAMVTLQPSLAEAVTTCLQKAEVFFNNSTAKTQLANLNEAFGHIDAFTDEYFQDATREVREDGFVARQANLNDVATTLVSMDKRFAHNWALLRPEEGFEASSLAELASSILQHLISSESESPPAQVDAVVEQLAVGGRPGAATGNRLLLYKPRESVAAASAGPKEVSPVDCGFLTLLCPRGGLEVRHPEKQSWERIEATEDCMVVLAGRLLQKITQGGFKASLHRMPSSTSPQVSLAYIAKPPPGTRMWLQLHMPGPPSMQIRVRTMQGQHILVSASGADTVAVLKRKVEAKAGFPAAQQNLIFQRRRLCDERTLADYGIEEMDLVKLVLGAGCLDCGPLARMLGADIEACGMWFDGDTIMGGESTPRLNSFQNEEGLKAEIEWTLARWTALMMMLHSRLGGEAALAGAEESLWKDVCSAALGVHLVVRIVEGGEGARQQQDVAVHSTLRCMPLLRVLRNRCDVFGEQLQAAEYALDGQTINPHRTLAESAIYDGAVVVMTRNPPQS